MLGVDTNSAIKRVQEELLCPICLDTAQLPVNFTCFRGCGGRFSSSSTCLRNVLCLHCANEALQLGRPPPTRFCETGGFAYCLICRDVRVDARMLTPDNAYVINHNVLGIMDALGMGATCRHCEEDAESQAALHQHYLRRCPAAVVKCRFRGCSHWHTRRAAAAHEDTCLVGRSQCGQCGIWVDRTELLRHMVTTCRLRVVNCVLCKHSALLPDMLEHLRLHQKQLQEQAGARAAAGGPAVSSREPPGRTTDGQNAAEVARRAALMAAAAEATAAATSSPVMVSALLVNRPLMVGPVAMQHQQQPQPQQAGAGAWTRTPEQMAYTTRRLVELMRHQEQLTRELEARRQNLMAGSAALSRSARTMPRSQELQRRRQQRQQVQQQVQEEEQERQHQRQEQQPQSQQQQPQQQQSLPSFSPNHNAQIEQQSSASPAAVDTNSIHTSGGGGGDDGGRGNGQFIAATSRPTLLVPSESPYAALTAMVSSWEGRAVAAHTTGAAATPTSSMRSPSAEEDRDEVQIASQPASSSLPSSQQHYARRGSADGDATANRDVSSFAIALEADSAGGDGSSDGGDRSISSSGSSSWRSLPGVQLAATPSARELQQASASAPGLDTQSEIRPVDDEYNSNSDGLVGVLGSGESPFADLVRRRGAFWHADLSGDGAGSSHRRSHGGGARYPSGTRGDYCDYSNAASESPTAAAAAAAADEAARMVRTAAAIVRASAAASERRSYRQLALTSATASNPGGVAMNGDSLGWRMSTEEAEAAVAAAWWGVGAPAPVGRSHAASAAAAAFGLERAGHCAPTSGRVPVPGSLSSSAGEVYVQATATQGSQITTMASGIRRSFSDTELVFDVLEELVRASNVTGECRAVRISTSGI